MTCSATIKYDKPLVRRALNRFMLKRLGKSFFVALFALTVVFAAAFAFGVWSWPLSVLGVVLLGFLAFLAFVYVARLRAAEGFFDKANEPTATSHFDTEGVRTESDLGTVDLKWQVFDEILRFPDVWLLVYAKSGYMTLPVHQLTPEYLQFIESQLGSSRNTPA